MQCIDIKHGLNMSPEITFASTTGIVGAIHLNDCGCTTCHQGGLRLSRHTLENAGEDDIWKLTSVLASAQAEQELL